ncbi:hypothetical protein C8R47DRAFT_400055 [Mycena vitilis]|nr:hypothetical protein C8R47DRAFT_400055 [Mycena vitilis]
MRISPWSRHLACVVSFICRFYLILRLPHLRPSSIPLSPSPIFFTDTPDPFSPHPFFSLPVHVLARTRQHMPSLSRHTRRHGPRATLIRLQEWLDRGRKRCVLYPFRIFSFIIICVRPQARVQTRIIISSRSSDSNTHTANSHRGGRPELKGAVIDECMCFSPVFFGPSHSVPLVCSCTPPLRSPLFPRSVAGESPSNKVHSSSLDRYAFSRGARFRRGTDEARLDARDRSRQDAY